MTAECDKPRVFHTRLSTRTTSRGSVAPEMPAATINSPR